MEARQGRDAAGGSMRQHDSATAERRDAQGFRHYRERSARHCRANFPDTVSEIAGEAISLRSREMSYQ
jgi:hypothetical protein